MHSRMRIAHNLLDAPSSKDSGCAARAKNRRPENRAPVLAGIERGRAAAGKNPAARATEWDR